MKNLRFTTFALGICLSVQTSYAQHAHLHVNPRWSQCSFQLDPSLTQSEWHEFAEEAGLVAYFRSLTDARPMGKGHFEIALLKWATKLDDSKPAWNNTFVHPDSTHWLKESPRLSIPGLTARIGITPKMDLGVYWIKNPGTNYGFYGGQLQYSLLSNVEKNWAAAARFNFNSIYGPADVRFNVSGLDLLASRDYKMFSNRLIFSTYAGVSTYVTHTHEMSAVVDLHDETVVGVQGMVGVVVKYGVARVGAEYNFARLSTVSVKLGVAF